MTVLLFFALVAAAAIALAWGLARSRSPRKSLEKLSSPASRMTAADASGSATKRNLPMQDRSKPDAARICIVQANDNEDAYCFQSDIGIFEQEQLLRIRSRTGYQDIPFSKIVMIIDRIRDRPQCRLARQAVLPVELAQVYGQTRIYVAGEGVRFRLVDPAGELFEIGRYLKEHIDDSRIDWDSDELDYLIHIAPDASTRYGDLWVSTNGDYLDRYLRRIKTRSEVEIHRAQAKKSWDSWAKVSEQTPKKIRDVLGSREFEYQLDLLFHDIEDREGTNVGSIGVTVGIARQFIQNVLLETIPVEYAAVSLLEEFDKMTWRHMISGKYDSTTVEKFLLKAKQVILSMDPQSRCQFW